MSKYSVEGLLSSGSSGPETFKFPTIGTSHTGVVTREEVQQSRAYNPDGPGALEFWDDGRPRLQLVLTFDTADGPRRLFCKGLMLKALKIASAQQGIKSLIGTTVTVAYVGDTPKRAKEYTVAVSVPAQAVPDVEGVLADASTPAPAAAPPTPAVAPATPAVAPATPAVAPATPAAAPPAPTAVADLTPDAIEALRRAGLVR